MVPPDAGTVSDQALVDAFAGGPLGVLVTRAASRPLLDGLLAEAARLGIAIRVFFTDEAVALLADAGWVDRLPAGDYSACDVSARKLGVPTVARVQMAGQYHNAIMVRDAVRVVTL